MPLSKPVRSYDCTQAELYAICTLGWNSFEENLADFTAFKTFYDAAFLAARRAEIDAAKLLPDDQARGALSESLRLQLSDAGKAAILKWKALSAYIKSTFPGEAAKPQLEAAGSDYYPTAYDEDWEDLELLLTAGDAYITANAATLTATGGMPAAFPADFTAAHAAYTPLYNQFKDAQQDSQEGTDDKVTANNDIHEKLMAMFDDGQIIYDDNPAKRDRFIFAQVKSLVTPSGSNGGGGNGSPDTTTITINGIVTEMGLGTPLENVSVVASAPEGISANAITDPTGAYSILFEDVPLTAEEDVTVEATLAGYSPSSTLQHVVAGETYTVDIELTPEA